MSATTAKWLDHWRGERDRHMRIARASRHNPGLCASHVRIARMWSRRVVRCVVERTS